MELPITRDEAKYMVDAELIARHFPINKTTAVHGLKVTAENYDRYLRERSGVTSISKEELRHTLGLMYEEIINVFKDYMELPEEYYKLLSLWIMGTYIHDSFNTYPFLFLNAMKGSGKTRTLKIIAHLAKGGNGEVHTGINETVLFRSVKGETLVLDEMESIGGRDKATLREYLNASYKKGATVARAKKVKDKEGETFKIEKFEPYRPLAMANIWGMNEVLGDRCITLILEKSTSPLFNKILENFERDDRIRAIKNNLSVVGVVWCNLCCLQDTYTRWNKYIKERHNNYTTTHTTYNTYTTQTTLEEGGVFNKIDESGISGRNLELFFPLFEVALFIDPLLFEEFLKIAVSMVTEKKEDEYMESNDVMFIEFVSQLSDDSFNYRSVTELTNEFKQYAEVSNEENTYVNSKWMGRAFKRLKLITSIRRVSRGRELIPNVQKAKKLLLNFKKSDDKTDKNETFK